MWEGFTSAGTLKLGRTENKMDGAKQMTVLTVPEMEINITQD